MPKKEKQIKKEKRRRKILTIASKLFQEKGFSRTTIAQIALKVGLSDTHLYRVFQEERAEIDLDFKEVLLICLFRDAWDEFIAITEQVAKNDTMNAREKIFFLYKGLLLRLDELGAWGVTFIMKGRQDGKLGELIVKAGVDKWAIIIDEIIKNGQENGIFRPDLNTQALRQNLIGCGETTLEGKILKTLADYPADYTLEDALPIFNAILDGISTREFLEKSNKVCAC